MATFLSAILSGMHKAIKGFRHRKLTLVGVVVCLIIGLGVWWWRTFYPIATATIPTAISSKLLFTPYIPQKLPTGYSIATSTFVQKEGALFFVAYNQEGLGITFSEQAAPKNFDTNGFYATNIKSPARLRNTTFATIFGNKFGQSGSIVGITTSDNTWVIVSSDKTLSQAEATELSKGLVKQD